LDFKEIKPAKDTNNQLLYTIIYRIPHPNIMQGEHWDVTHSGEEQQAGDRPPRMQQQPFIGFGIDQNWGGFGQMIPQG
jgi:hypothetical protein